MDKKWYRNPVTWACGLLCAAALVLGLGLFHGAELPEEVNLRVEVAEECGVYELQFSRFLSSGGVMNADGSPLTLGQTYGWKAGDGVATVNILAVDRSKKVLCETTVTWDFSLGPCTLRLTSAGLMPAESCNYNS